MSRFHNDDKAWFTDLSDRTSVPPLTAEMWTQSAPPEAVEIVLAADVDSDEGRSEFIWIRFPNGDLALAVFPQGDTYFATEGWRDV